jgi:DNA replication protein DnaC
LNNTLERTLRKLRLSGLAGTLDVRLQEAASNRLSHAEFLELILQDEMTVRKDRLIARRTKAAKFRDQKNLEDFDWSFNPKVNKKQVYDLATCRFVEQAKDALLLGPPGVGKSHLAQAIGRQAVNMGHVVLYRSIFDLAREFIRDETLEGADKVLNKYLKADLLIIDDMGMKKLPPHSGEFLMEVVMRRHENKSTIMTSNRPIEEWGKLIGDVPAATAILDRFLQGAEIIEITGKSYRLKDKACKSVK